MNITPIRDEAEFLSVCKSVSSQMPRLIDYMKRELERNIFTYNTRDILKRQDEFKFLDKLETIITSNAVKFGE